MTLLIPFAANTAASAAVKTANAFKWLEQPPQLPLHLWASAPRLTQGLRPKRHLDWLSRFCTAYRRLSRWQSDNITLMKSRC